MTQLKICSKTQKHCNNSCKINGYDTHGSHNPAPTFDKSFSIQLQGSKWFRVKTLEEIYDIFDQMVRADTEYMIVGGNTAQGRLGLLTEEVLSDKHTEYMCKGCYLP